MREETVSKLNDGVFDEDVLSDFVISFVGEVKEKFIQRFYRNKRNNGDKRFAEYLLVELTRTLYCMPPATFYLVLRNNRRIRSFLGLEQLKTLGNYKDFDRKRKYSKMHLDRIMKRNLET